MLAELTPDEFSAALDSVAAEALLSLADTIPPVDALALARALGLSLAWDERQPGRGRIARLCGRPGSNSQGSILLKPEVRRERLHWAVAHEIGEWCAVQVFDRLGVDPREAPPGSRENVANQLAGRILLPREPFAQVARECVWDLPELKFRFATASHELIARRMLDFELPIVITVFDQGRRGLRRGNLPFCLPPLAELEANAWRAAHETSEPIVAEDSHWRVQAWPVHEPDWKREVLRSEWQGSEC